MDHPDDDELLRLLNEHFGITPSATVPLVLDDDADADAAELVRHMDDLRAQFGDDNGVDDHNFPEPFPEPPMLAVI